MHHNGLDSRNRKRSHFVRTLCYVSLSKIDGWRKTRGSWSKFAFYLIEKKMKKSEIIRWAREIEWEREHKTLYPRSDCQGTSDGDTYLITWKFREKYIHCSSFNRNEKIRRRFVIRNGHFAEEIPFSWPSADCVFPAVHYFTIMSIKSIFCRRSNWSASISVRPVCVPA